jgi:hypothetical protein
MGTLKEKFRQCFLKPWSSIYSTKMFFKNVLDKVVGHGGKRSGAFKRKGHW